jgi:hypothetical protein
VHDDIGEGTADINSSARPGFRHGRSLEPVGFLTSIFPCWTEDGSLHGGENPDRPYAW